MDHQELVKLLKQIGVYPHVSDYDGLYRAIQNGSDEVIHWIDESSDGKRDTLLLHLLKVPKCDERIIRLLIQQKCDINYQNQAGVSALIRAARYCSSEIVQLLVESGANLDLQHNDGGTALMVAARYSNTTSSLETIKLLVESGAHLDLQNKERTSALMRAARYSNTESSLETVKLLVDAGANLDLRDCYGQTALVRAARRSNTTSSLETVKLLVKGGANLDLRSRNGRTAEMLISNSECRQFIRLYPLQNKSARFIQHWWRFHHYWHQVQMDLVDNRDLISDIVRNTLSNHFQNISCVLCQSTSLCHEIQLDQVGMYVCYQCIILLQRNKNTMTRFQLLCKDLRLGVVGVVSERG